MHDVEVTTKAPLTVELEHLEFVNAIDIRWVVDLQDLDRRAYEELAQTLSVVEGVEEVVMRRYSARITLADHVATAATSLDAIAETIYEQLRVLEGQGFDLAVEIVDS